VVPEVAYGTVVEEELVAIIRPAKVVLRFAGKELQEWQGECRAADDRNPVTFQDLCGPWYMEASTTDVHQYRRLLFSIAYNMLGTIDDAEDMVQETYASWFANDRSAVKEPRHYLIRTISNKCITHLKKLQKQRGSYKGTWLPEPLLSEPEDKDVLSIGFLYLLEELSPIERGIIILREAFDMEYEELADIFELSNENCRQHLSRAKKKLADARIRSTSDRQKHERLLQAFLKACFDRDLDQLVGILREDVIVYGDAGGKGRANPKPVGGRENVVKLLMGGMAKGPAFARIVIHAINGFPAAFIYERADGQLPGVVIVLDAGDDDRIGNIYFLANPDKLQHLAAAPVA
jgi:RNA polymerase sigma-70 factor, ECF subfamily